MSNILSPEKQTAVISALAEGNSIRSVERMTGIHRDTVMRLGLRVGEGCAAIMDSTMRNLECRLIQMDEIWGFVGKKNKNASVQDRCKGLGDVWTFVAIVYSPTTPTTITFYVNDLSTTGTVTALVTPDVGDLVTGADLVSGPPFMGNLGTIRVYGRALNAVEVKSIFTSSAP